MAIPLCPLETSLLALLPNSGDQMMANKQEDFADGEGSKATVKPARGAGGSDLSRTPPPSAFTPACAGLLQPALGQRREPALGANRQCGAWLCPLPAEGQGAPSAKTRFPRVCGEDTPQRSVDILRKKE